MSIPADTAERSDRTRFWRAFGAGSLALLCVMGGLAVAVSPARMTDQYSASSEIAGHMERAGGGRAVKLGFEDGGEPDGMSVFYHDPDGSYADLSIEPDGSCSKVSYGFFSQPGGTAAPGGCTLDLEASCAAFDRLSALAAPAGGAASAVGEGFAWLTDKRVSKAKVSRPYAFTKSRKVDDADGRSWYVFVAISNAGDKTLVEATVAPVPGF